jgi:hypothetical protein
MSDPNDPVDMTTSERWFGRNLDEFSIRLGVVFGIANLILSAISLSESTDPLGKASNGLFVAGAAIETITYAAGWFVQGALGATTTMLETLATVMSACTVVAAALAVVGLIITLIQMFEHQPTPIETFATGKAKDAGLLMPLEYQVESLMPFTPKDEPSKEAVALSTRSGDGAALRLGPDATVTLSPPDHTNATSLALVSNGTGQFRIASVLAVANTSLLCLTVSGNTLAAAAYIDADATGAAGTNAAESQLWLADPVAPPQTVSVPSTQPGAPATTCVAAGTFHISPLGNPALFLDLSGSVPTLGTAPSPVTMTMVTVAAQGLGMADVLLSTADRDRRFMPSLITSGSSPRSFALAPALPAGLTFDPATGIISQTEGIAPPLAAPTPYTLTCNNGVGLPAAVTFQLSVRAPATAAG